ncbi:hypothetical protein DAEQUDRAFT_728137 [Daedalea quercina L-15889]|uniref:Uncharacterized protein n=1 Tax=Daedalea quercina L-15889 TaxID=1314783 RepID=A0A165PKP3_9APHY|nr:hypothetical protein DAEQUDRAFT_728137 [Daedalea quercina L-15889]
MIPRRACVYVSRPGSSVVGFDCPKQEMACAPSRANLPLFFPRYLPPTTAPQ